MSRALLTLLLLCSLVACDSKRQELVDPEIVERDGIEYLARSTEPLTADVMQWRKNGQPQTQYTLIDGKREGLFRKWHNNGQLGGEGYYVKDKEEGLYRSWWENGQLAGEENYVNGKREGLIRSWHRNGQLDWDRNYVNGECVSGCE